MQENPYVMGEYEGYGYLQPYSSEDRELINELLNVTNELEFESVIGKVAKGITKFYNSPQGQAIKRDFINGAKQFGKKMIPSLGRNIGSYIGGSTGRKIGQIQGNKLIKNHRDARDYAKIIRHAANNVNVALKSGSTIPPRTLITHAINAAARPVIIYRRQTAYVPQVINVPTTPTVAQTTINPASNTYRPPVVNVPPGTTTSTPPMQINIDPVQDVNAQQNINPEPLQQPIENISKAYTPPQQTSGVCHWVRQGNNLTLIGIL